MTQLQSPERIALDLVEQFSWGSNVAIGGRLVGQQYVVAGAIAKAIQEERERCAEIARARPRERALVTNRRRLAIWEVEIIRQSVGDGIADAILNPK